MKPTDWVIEDLERKRRISIPLGVKEFKNRDRLDSMVAKKNIEMLSLFFSKESNFDFNALELMNDELKIKRKVSEGDLFFINNLVKEIKAHGGFETPLTNSIGSLLQVEETFKEAPIKKLPKNILVVLMLWSYLTMIESCISDISELFYRIAKVYNDKKYLKLYEHLLKEGYHPMFGQIKKTALRLKLIRPQDKTFLDHRTLRGYIAHANLYYDSVRDKIIFPHDEELTWDKFEEEYKRVHDFFKELIFKLNDEDTDIKSTADKLRKGLYHQYLKLARSGGTKKLWKSDKKLPWELK